MKLFFILLSILSNVCLYSQSKGVKQVLTESPKLPTNTYAVVVGISDYQDPGIPDLRFADKDAEAFANFLRSPSGGSLNNDHLKLLTNNQATAGQVVAALTWLMDVCKEGDQAIIYFSGHGDVETKLLNQLGFLLLWDSPPRVYLAGALPVDMLRQIVTTLSIEQKTKVFLVVDACRAGKLAGNTIIGTQLTNNQLAQQFSHEQKILSCQPNEYSIEGQQWGGGRGVFSYHFCNGVYGMADSNHDGQVTLLEIGRYLEDHVPNDVAPISQLPLTIGDKTSKLFDVDKKSLEILEKKGFPPPVIANVEQRGILNEVLAKADTTIRFWYKRFEQTIQEQQYFKPETDCTEYFYQQLIADKRISAIHPMLRRNYAAALQDDAQQTLNEWLKTKQDVSMQALGSNHLPEKVFTQKVRTYPRCLDRAAELLGEKHYMYNTLKARKYFFEGYLLANSNPNPNKELGEQALSLFRQSLAWQPEQPQVYWQMSKVFGYNFLQPDSLEYYTQKALEVYPNWINPCLDGAFWLSFQFRNQERARPLMEQANRIDSSSIVLMHLWAIFNFGENNFQEAERQLKKAMAFDSTNASIWSNLGYLYNLTQRYEEAEPVLKKAIELDSTYTIALGELGTLFARTHRFGEAEPVLKKAIGLDSTFRNAWNNLGFVYLQTHRYKEAEQTLKKAIALDSTFANPHKHLGMVYLKTNRPEEARAYFLKALELNPNYVPAMLGMAYALALEGKGTEALGYVEQAIGKGSTYENLKQDEDLAPLCSLPEWMQLMKKHFPDKVK